MLAAQPRAFLEQPRKVESDERGQERFRHGQRYTTRRASRPIDPQYAQGGGPITPRLLSFVALLFAFVFPALAQYPSRPIKILPNAAAGTGPDIMARLLGAKLQESMGQPVVVESRPGANGDIAGEYVAQSAPDGYTLALRPTHRSRSIRTYSKLGFDWIKDFTPVASLATEAFKLVVSNQVPATNVAEFITYAKSLKQPLFYGSSGTGSQHHLTMEMLKERTGINLTHIPYKGGGSATAQALLAGEVQATIGGAAVDSHVKAGKLRALGIRRRSARRATPICRRSARRCPASRWWRGTAS